ncbi:hypothetical protein ACFCXA_23005 [Streptomyces virginiae]|uniref:hypothetical protein n=1 Tax=Streptomyces virginiae TaxID=1961 RepID=UPI0035DF7DB8
MDSGRAALLGASVGSATTLGAAIVKGRAQARSQQARWCCRTLAREVHRACEVGILEGPAPLADVAGSTTHKARDIALAAERERSLYEAVEDFRLAARGAIGETD